MAEHPEPGLLPSNPFLGQAVFTEFCRGSGRAACLWNFSSAPTGAGFPSPPRGFSGTSWALKGPWPSCWRPGSSGSWYSAGTGSHPASICFPPAMVAFGASLSAFWIMVANSWMQTPAGGSWVNRPLRDRPATGRRIFNPDLPWGVSAICGWPAWRPRCSSWGA